MSESTDRVSLGGRVSEGDQHTVHRVRDISEELAGELEVKFRTIREMAEPGANARMSASATRLLALFETAESELEDDGVISALTQKTARLELGPLLGSPASTWSGSLSFPKEQTATMRCAGGSTGDSRTSACC